MSKFIGSRWSMAYRLFNLGVALTLPAALLIRAAPVADATETDPFVTNHRTVFDNSAPAVPENAPGITFKGSGIPPNGNSLCDLQNSQWTFVRNSDNTVDADIKNKVIEGQVVYAKLSTDDNPFNHDSRDRNIIVYPDLAYWGMLATPGNFQTGEPNEHGRIELEWEAAAMPAWVLPNQGDRVHVQGNYIFDCAHPAYRTEIHPPRLLMTLRDAAQGWAGGKGDLYPRPGWAATMPGLGSLPVQTTRADVFASSDGGEACDTVLCLPQNNPYNDAYQPLNDSNYDLFVPAPPQPAGNYQMIWTITPRNLPSCFSDDSDCGMDDILVNHPERFHFGEITVGGQPGVGIHVDFTNYTPNSNGLYGFGFTANVAWNKRADVPPRRIRVTLDNIYVANPMDGSPPLGCISTAQFCDGQFAIHTIIGDQFKHLRLCCASQDTSDNVHQDVPYSEDVNNYLYLVDGTSSLCGLASAGNPDGNQCQNSFEQTLSPGQPLRVFLRGDEWEAVTNFCTDTGCGIDNVTNKDVGVVEHIFAGDPAAGSDVELSNYGIGGGVNHDGHYTEWFQDRLSAGDDNLNGYCSPPNGPCVNVSYHIEDAPYPNVPATTVSLDPSSPQYAANGTTFVTSGTLINLAGSVTDSGANSFPESRPGDPLVLHYRSYPTGSTTLPADSLCATVIGPVNCSTTIRGTDGPYTLEYWTEDAATGVLEPVRTVQYTVDNTPPQIAIVQPTATNYAHSAILTLAYTVDDGAGSGVRSFTPTMDNATTLAGHGLASGQVINLLTEMTLGQHTFRVSATDNLGNTDGLSVTFSIIVTPDSIIGDVNQFLAMGEITQDEAQSLLAKLQSAKKAFAIPDCANAATIYQSFISEVQAQSGKHIDPTAATIMIQDAQYLIVHCP